MKDIVHQLAAQGLSVEAIAAFMQTSTEWVKAQLVACDMPASETAEHGGRRRVQAPREELAQQPVAPPGRKTAEDIGRATIERLARQTAEQQAQAQALRDEIARLLDSDKGPARGRAKRIQPQLSRPIALRTVQWHIAAIAKRSAP